MIPHPENAGVIAFDLDGTLIDSAPDIAYAANVTLQSIGYAGLPIHEVEPLIGLPAAAIFSYAGVSDTDTAVTLFRANLAEVAGRFSAVYPGVLEGLEILAARGWSLAVATNKPTGLARIAIDRAGLSPWFPIIVGADRGMPKPDPSIVLQCAKEAGAHVCWMVGDTEMDIQAGRAAGARTVAIASGSHSKTRLEAQAPDAVFDSFETFTRTLKSAT